MNDLETDRNDSIAGDFGNDNQDMMFSNLSKKPVEVPIKKNK